jgi:hypothetical protein
MDLGGGCRKGWQERKKACTNNFFHTIEQLQKKKKKKKKKAKKTKSAQGFILIFLSLFLFFCDSFWAILLPLVDRAWDLRCSRCSIESNGPGRWRCSKDRLVDHSLVAGGGSDFQRRGEWWHPVVELVCSSSLSAKT